MYYYCRVLFLSAVCAGSLLTRVRATDVAVSVRDNFFDPRNVTINVNDRVVWTWAGVASHDTTGPGNPPLWQSPLQSSGTFAYVFTTTGTFNYRCTLHSQPQPTLPMVGSVTVQVGNTPQTTN